MTQIKEGSIHGDFIIAVLESRHRQVHGTRSRVASNQDAAREYVTMAKKTITKLARKGKTSWVSWKYPGFLMNDAGLKWLRSQFGPYGVNVEQASTYGGHEDGTYDYRFVFDWRVNSKPQGE